MEQFGSFRLHYEEGFYETGIVEFWFRTMEGETSEVTEAEFEEVSLYKILTDMDTIKVLYFVNTLIFIFIINETHL